MFGITLPPWAMALILKVAMYGAIAAAGAVAWTYVPLIGPHAVETRLGKDVDTWKAAEAKWEAAANGWQASFKSSEAIRDQETSTARAAVNSDAQACDARVAEARRSISALQALTRKEPTLDPATHCPVRALMPDDGLRDALQPGAP